MQYVLSFLIVAALLAGGWYYWNSAPPADNPASDTSSEEVMNENETMDEDETMEDDATVEVDADVSVDAADAKVFDVTGTNYEFDVTEIRVQEGDTVTINFASAEGFHDWVVDQFDAATERVAAGGETSVTFVADTAGTYEFYCSVGTHREMGMVGTLIVE